MAFLKRILLGITFLALVQVVGCDNAKSLVVTTPIGEVVTKQSQHINKLVRVTGQVTMSTSLMGTGGFLLQDATGTIAVASETLLPRTGERVTVRGRVVHLATLGSSSAVMIVAQ